MSPRRALQWMKLLFADLGRSRTFGIACEMAFWLFLSLIPLAAVAGLVVARFAVRGNPLANAWLATFPPAVRDLVTGELSRVSAWNGGAVAPLAALTFVWLASSGVHAVFDGLELETESLPRAWWKKRLLGIASCFALSIGAAAIALLATGLGWLKHLLGEAMPVVEGGGFALGGVLRMAAGVAIAIGLVAGLYTIGLPRETRKRMPLLPGAVVAVALQAALGFAYGVYVRRAGDGGAYQAGLAVIAVTLIALYLFCIALLVGAEVNQLLGARRLLQASVHPPVVPPPAPVTDSMVACDRPVHVDRNELRPSFAGGA